ncbi:MAG TPA: helix-hairpin-helix domain-containing protein [Nitrospiria bacterium]
MTNQQIASVFQNFADRLQLEGANPFRIRAYRRAATAIDRLKVPAVRLADHGRLREIPGIGRDLEQKIHELLKTGTIRDPVEKNAEPPAPGAAPFRLPGLDPKLAGLLHRRFHIETLHDLELLARSHLLRTLPGLGAQLEKSILDGIENEKKH